MDWWNYKNRNGNKERDQNAKTQTKEKTDVTNTG